MLPNHLHEYRFRQCRLSNHGTRLHAFGFVSFFYNSTEYRDLYLQPYPANYTIITPSREACFLRHTQVIQFTQSALYTILYVSHVYAGKY